MNTPNPLHPQGTFPDARGRSHIRIAVFTILAIHVVLLGALLLQGCKKTTNDPGAGGDTTTALPPFAPTTNVVTSPPEIAPFAPPPEVAKIEPPPPAPVPAHPPELPKVEPPSPEAPKIVEPQPTPPVPPAGPNREHVISKGDSFFTLGKKYGVTLKAIADANPGVDSRRLKIKQTLIIPAAVAPPAPQAADSAAEGKGTIYVVKSSDSLTSVGRKFGTTAKALRRENNLKTDRLLVGQKLKVPAATAKASKAPAKASPDSGTASAPK